MLITESHIWLVLIFLPPFYFAGTPVRDLAYTLPWILSTVSWSSQTAFNLSSICLLKQHHLFFPPPSPALLKDNRALPSPIHRITALTASISINPFPCLHPNQPQNPPLPHVAATKPKNHHLICPLINQSRAFSASPSNHQITQSI